MVQWIYRRCIGMIFKKKAEEIKQIYSCEGNAGCLASNRITVDGMKVGYMYREAPDSTWPDSGWRFFAGDETEEYTENPDNFNIFDLNTVCNYDPDIIPLLSTEYGYAYVRDGKEFVKEEFIIPEEL